MRGTMCQRRCAVALSVLACGLPAVAAAEVHVEGSPAAVRITTNQDAISDVLSAITATFHVRYRTAVPLTETANANYSGSFERVIARLLEGYNYVIKKEQETTEIVVFGKHGEATIPPRLPEVPADKN